MSDPTVTVILPVYNGENYVRFAVESVLNQTVKDLELVVVDDGSSDSTPEIIGSYGPPVRYVKQENTGVAGAFNHGLQLARGKYISWLSHDDIFHPQKLEKQLEALSKLDSPGICYTDIESIDSEGKVVTEHKLPEYVRGETLRHVLTGGPICGACYSLMYDRRCVERAGAYAVELRYAQDVDMLSRLVRHFPLLHVPEPLIQVREHATRAIHSDAWKREVRMFFGSRLASTPFEELFPEHGDSATKLQRSLGFRWLGDILSTQPEPIRGVAFSQYRRAWREDPWFTPVLARRIARLWWLRLRKR
ncbi:MAG TPA: glycosyltransferase [Pyrinomonadaceae bacterium]|nr:glycosyltransferase [Pyrinomonadaceae bacterium]